MCSENILLDLPCKSECDLSVGRGTTCHAWWIVGDVVLKETFEKYIKPEGEYNGKQIHPEDAIELQRGGTGFAEHDGDKIKSKKFWALGPGSGKQDLRGQHQGAQSKFGLVFRN